MSELYWPDSSYSHQLERKSIIFHRITQIHSGVIERDQDKVYFMRRLDSNPRCYAVCQRLLICVVGCSRQSNKQSQDQEVGMAAKSHVTVIKKPSEGFCETNLVHKFSILLTIFSEKSFSPSYFILCSFFIDTKHQCTNLIRTEGAAVCAHLASLITLGLYITSKATGPAELQ